MSDQLIGGIVSAGFFLTTCYIIGSMIAFHSLPDKTSKDWLKIVETGTRKEALRAIWYLTAPVLWPIYAPVVLLIAIKHQLTYIEVDTDLLKLPKAIVTRTYKELSDNTKNQS